MERYTIETMPEQRAALVNAKLRTLVVDDTPELLHCITQLLEASGTVEVIATAVNGVEAIQLATALKPDLVLMDVNMPVMDGLTSAREIKDAAPGVQVLLMSAENSPTLRDLAARAGTDHFIAKAELLLGTSLLLRMLAA